MIHTVDSPLGVLSFTLSERGLTRFCFDAIPPEADDGQDGPPGLADAVRDAVTRYFAGELGALDALPVDPQGTPFQMRVWARLRQIPAGQTLSYEAFAEALGDVLIIRAAAQAIGQNPVGLVIPCHRVLGKSGDLVGFAAGLSRKARLLRHEGWIKPGEDDRTLPLFRGR